MPSAKKKLAQEEKQRAEAQRKAADKQRDRAELLVYAGKLALAQREWQDNNGARAIELLGECQWTCAAGSTGTYGRCTIATMSRFGGTRTG